MKNSLGVKGKGWTAGRSCAPPTGSAESSGPWLVGGFGAQKGGHGPSGESILAMLIRSILTSYS